MMKDVLPQLEIASSGDFRNLGLIWLFFEMDGYSKLKGIGFMESESLGLFR